MGKIFQFGKFKLNADDQTLSVDEKAIRLTTKEFEILILLIENNGQLLSKDEMMNAIWQETFVEESNLAHYISRLRKILNSDGQEYIKTYSKRGYRFSAALSVSENNSIIERRIRLQITQKDELTQKKLGEINSLAVLPFYLLGFQTDEEFLGLGMTDALITQLNQTGQIIVRPTAAILQYAGSPQNPAEIGNNLGVDAVLQGSFQKSGNKLRLNVQMLETKSENITWAEVFNSEIEDIFAVQDKIAEKIVSALSKKLSAESQAGLTKRYTENIEAYQEYLKGRFYWNKRSVENIKKALVHFEKAIELEPLYALAYTGIAAVYETLPLLDEIPPRNAFPRAKAATLRALEIDPNLAEAHAALGIYLMNYEWNWQGAEVSFKKAIELNDNYAAGHQIYATFLLRLGRVADAVIELKKARTLDPLSPVINTWLAEAFSYLGEYEASILLHKETISFSPDYFLAYYHLTLTYVMNNQPDEAVKISEAALRLSNDSSLAQYSSVVLQIVLGNKKAARATLENLIASRRQKYVSASNIASCFAAFKEKKKALEWLAIGIEEKDPNLTWTKIDPEFVFLRKDAEFLKILQQINL